jgi:hypothetical protein
LESPPKVHAFSALPLQSKNSAQPLIDFIINNDLDIENKIFSLPVDQFNPPLFVGLIICAGVGLYYFVASSGSGPLPKEWETGYNSQSYQGASSGGNVSNNPGSTGNSSNLGNTGGTGGNGGTGGGGGGFNPTDMEIDESIVQMTLSDFLGFLRASGNFLLTRIEYFRDAFVTADNRISSVFGRNHSPRNTMQEDSRQASQETSSPNLPEAVEELVDVLSDATGINQEMQEELSPSRVAFHARYNPNINFGLEQINARLVELNNTTQELNRLVRRVVENPELLSDLDTQIIAQLSILTDH